MVEFTVVIKINPRDLSDFSFYLDAKIAGNIDEFTIAKVVIELRRDT
jgi:hypothetical protein